MERLAPEQHDTLDGVVEPAENPVLVGHRAMADGLASAYRAGHLPHGLMFVGPKGIGKATLAFHLANHLLAHVRSEDAPVALSQPDAASGRFRQIASGAHPGVLHLTRPWDDKTKKFRTALTVEEIRRINRFLSLSSADGGYRVVIVDPADDMNVNAANALLKNLEEPPARTVFILIVNSPGSVLPTLRSRCQIVRFTPLADDDVATALGHVSEAAVPTGDVLRASGGSVRRAILLGEYGGVDISDALQKVATARQKSVAEVHALADAVSGRDRAIQFELFNEFVLDLMSDQAAVAARAGQLDRAEGLSRGWTEMRIAINEAETYNLDRKQHALSMIFRLNDALRM
jgi:DNA polymerase III subunit delta'